MPHVNELVHKPLPSSTTSSRLSAHTMRQGKKLSVKTLIGFKLLQESRRVIRFLPAIPPSCLRMISCDCLSGGCQLCGSLVSKTNHSSCKVLHFRIEIGVFEADRLTVLKDELHMIINSDCD